MTPDERRIADELADEWLAGAREQLAAHRAECIVCKGRRHHCSEAEYLELRIQREMAR